MQPVREGLQLAMAAAAWSSVTVLSAEGNSVSIFSLTTLNAETARC